MRSVVNAFWQDETGATAVEYGLLVGLIALIAIVGLTSAFNAISARFTQINGTLSAS